ncbi:methyltransferase domain-containing protein [Pseudomonas anguilliseptica]|uniref:methyltransferase domain-containing protein n=1 Tax=Pseudomonas anguilliseptica TaxID=53406 RepID=UPI00325BA198
MSQDTRLYGDAQVWDQELQLGQLNLVQAIRDFWPAGIGSVLDVGCGDGKLTSRLAAPGALKIVGLDSSAEALSRLPFDSVLGDAQALPFPQAAFDLVMSTDTLEHMPAAEENAAWSELFRVAGKAVMVAVPFREELLDATARCADCGNSYHVNWHQRRYDIADLHRRAPAGWQVRATILAGEPWSAMLPPETHLRRSALGEWSGWELAICPHCGSGGQAAAPEQPLQSLLAQALAKQLYPVLAEQRYCRSHSEILVIFQRADAALTLPTPRLAEASSQPASRVDFEYAPAAALHPFCQVAHRVACVGGLWRLQFPLFESAPTLRVSRQPGSQGALQLLLEDSIGTLFDGCVLEDGQAHSTHQLPREPVAGYYGVLASCANDEPFASVQLGQAPDVLWVAGDDNACRYLQLSDTPQPFYVQVTQTLWFDPATLNSCETAVMPTQAQVLLGLQACFDNALKSCSADEHSEAQAAELNQLRVQIQNLSAEHDALQQRAAEAEQFAVQLQNITVERDALRQRALEADHLLVQLQNLNAERDTLLQRATEADQIAVQLQNLSAEHDALQQRAAEAEQFAVQLQNITVERDALRQRALEADHLLVQLQNLNAERDTLLQRATEADQIAVQLQNLSAEHDALQQRAAEAEQFAVQLQNITVERDALRQRALEADHLLVQLQKLNAERDTLLQRATEADQIAVQLQNLSAEHDALQQRAAEAEQFAVQLQNITVERDALRQRALEADHLLVQLQNLNAERDALLQRATEADQIDVQLQNLIAEHDALQQRAVEGDRLAVQVQNFTAERETLLQRVQEADQLAVQVQNLSADRNALLQRALEADRLAVQLQNLSAERDALSQQVQNHIEAQHQQDQHFHQRSSEMQAQLQESLGRLAKLEAEN